jgi:ubiquinol-cytochrome c reductase cytochrome b subunit
MRVAVFLGPVIAYIITKRWCISLQRKDEEVLLHGYETGIIMRSPEGGYSERHLPVSEDRAFTMIARDRDPDLAELQAGSDGTDPNGLEPKRSPLAGIRRRLQTTMYADNIQKPTAEELEAAHHHAEHEHELQAAMEGVSADGHQFDGHHLVEDEALRGD